VVGDVGPDREDAGIDGDRPVLARLGPGDDGRVEVREPSIPKQTSACSAISSPCSTSAFQTELLTNMPASRLVGTLTK